MRTLEKTPEQIEKVSIKPASAQGIDVSALNLIKTKDRSFTVDIMRGIAIFTMVAANLAGNMLAPPHAIAFRLYGTFAAPMFITLSGMMVARSTRHNLNYYLVRGGLVMLMGMLVDLLIFHWSPLNSFDVLYLIGISMPIAYLVGRLGAVPRWLAMLSIFILTPLLQNFLGYTAASPDLRLAEHPFPELLVHPANVLHHFFVDGWFPFFPWVAFSLFGVNLHYLSKNLGRSFNALTGFGGGLILLHGIVVWLLLPGPLFVREGYSEMFYPPTYGYMLTAIGVIMTAYFLVDSSRNMRFWTPLRLLGQCSLFAYILQYTLDHFFFAAFWPHSSFPVFILCYLTNVATLIAAAYALRRYKDRYQPRSFLLNFLIGS